MKKLSKNLSNEEIFNRSKADYKNALKDSGFQLIKLEYKKTAEEKKITTNKIYVYIWFNSPFNENVCRYIAKRFLNLIDKHSPKNDKLHNIFSRNSVKVSYCCTKNMKLVITTNNRKLLSENINTVPPCNCRVKNRCPLNGKCRTRNILDKCVTSTSMKSDKVYLGTTEGDFKQRFYNHKKSFNNSTYSNDTTSPNAFGTSKKKKKKIQRNHRFEIVPSKDSSIIFEYNQKVFAVPCITLTRTSYLTNDLNYCEVPPYKYLLCNYKSNNQKHLKE